MLLSFINRNNVIPAFTIALGLSLLAMNTPVKADDIKKLKQKIEYLEKKKVLEAQLQDIQRKLQELENNYKVSSGQADNTSETVSKSPTVKPQGANTGDGVYKAVDYNGSALWHSEIMIKDGKLQSFKLSFKCYVCNTNTQGANTCHVDGFAKNNPLTDTSITCDGVAPRHFTGNIYESLQSDGSERGAGAANLKFITGRQLELFEAEVAKSGNKKLTTRDFAGG